MTKTKNNFTYATICVDLDTMLDTRLGTLLTLGEEKFNKNFDPKKYFNRTIDEFPDYDFKEFRKLYSNRDKRTLLKSISSYIPKLVMDYARSAWGSMYTTPWSYVPRVVLNTYPYKLTDNELNIIKLGIVQSNYENIDILDIHKSPEELTPEYLLNTKIDMIVMYDFYMWLDIHTRNKNLEKTPIPTIEVVTPKLTYLNGENSYEYQQAVSKGFNPFDALIEIFSPLVRLRFLPAGHFSAALVDLNPFQPFSIYEPVEHVEDDSVLNNVGMEFTNRVIDPQNQK